MTVAIALFGFYCNNREFHSKSFKTEQISVHFRGFLELFCCSMAFIMEYLSLSRLHIHVYIE